MQVHPSDISVNSLSTEHQQLLSIFAYDPETGIFHWRVNRSRARIGNVAGSVTTKGRITIRFNGKQHQGHRLAWFYHYGKWPSMDIDHINGNPLDNRIANLREATESENGANSKLYTNNTSGIKGVTWIARERKWRAAIQCRGRTICIGTFSDKERAAAAYREKAKILFGDFARPA